MTIRMTEEDWKRVENLTEEEITKAAMEDPDCYLPTPEELKNGWVVLPKRSGVMIPVDPSTANWLIEHRINFVPMVQQMLRAIVSAHRPS